MSERKKEQSPADRRRLSLAMWCAGIASFSLLHAPQGLLTFIAADLDRSAPDVAWVVSGATLGIAVSLPLWAIVSGRIGITNAMRLASLSSAGVALLLPLAPTLEVLVAGRFLQGALLGGIPALAVALLHDRLTGGAAAIAAGTYIAASSIGGLSGRIIAPVIADLVGWRLGMFLLDLVGAALTVTMAALLPRAVGASRSAGQTLRAFLAQLRDPRLVALFAIGGMMLGALMGMFNAITFRLEAAPYLLPATVVSFLFLAYLGGTVSAQASGRLTLRFGPRPPLLAGCTLMLAGAALTAAAPLPLVITGVVLVTTGMFLVHSIASSEVARVADTDRASAGSMYNVFYYAGAGIIGWLCAAIWSCWGWAAVAASIGALAVGAAVFSVAATRRPA